MSTTVGPILRDWRQRRRLSQLDLAVDAEVSTRHLSFIETGRSRPSRELVLHLARLDRQAAALGDDSLRELAAELRSYPGVVDAIVPADTASLLFVPLVLGTEGGELRFFSTIATFGTALDITVADMAIESFFPADEVTASALNQAAARST